MKQFKIEIEMTRNKNGTFNCKSSATMYNKKTETARLDVESVVSDHLELSQLAGISIQFLIEKAIENSESIENGIDLSMLH